MKNNPKKNDFLFFLVAAALVALPACHSLSQQTSPVVNENNYKKEGWIDEHSFRVMVMGAPRRGEKNIRKRKEQAKAAAIIYAQRTIVEKFVYLPLNPGVGYINIEPRKARVIKHFEEIIKLGSIIEISYDENQYCEIVYQVSTPELKKKVMSMSYE